MAETSTISPEIGAEENLSSLLLAFEGLSQSLDTRRTTPEDSGIDDPVVADIFGDTEVPIAVREKFRTIVEKGGKVGMETAKWLAHKKTWILAGGSVSEMLQNGKTDELEYWVDYLVDYYT